MLITLEKLDIGMVSKRTQRSVMVFLLQKHEAPDAAVNMKEQFIR